MKNRLFGNRKKWLIVLSLFSICGLTNSCSDNYDLDDTTPSYLGGSIYGTLKDRGDFENVVSLIDDLGYTEVLNKTGSKTLLIANDDAFTKFYATTKWSDASGNPVRNYDQLTLAQKKLLLNSAMLDNQYLVEMLPHESGSGGSLLKNVSLRRPTAVSITDSIPYFKSDELPKTNNHEDQDFWSNYNQGTRDGIYLALDGTVPLLTHFIAGQMENVGITAEDFKTISGADEYTRSDAYIYNSKIVEQDITCLNGYIDRLDEVLQTPSNMAEVIRTSGFTDVFSHMLDRFSGPFYNGTLTALYSQLYEGVDSVFEKRYFSNRSQGGNGLKITNAGVALPSGYSFLNYDPGWNTYFNASSSVQEDMAAMFVPSDEALRTYFEVGAGSAFIKRYSDKENTSENLYYNIDQIPLNIIQALINNLMKSSFNETVPSKYLSIKNDARDQMFDAGSYPTAEAYKTVIDTCMLACNGAVYVLNKVFSPAAYAAVSAPALIGSNTRIVNAVISADDNFIQGSSYSSAPLKQYFSTYLKAMQSRFTFLIPTDEALDYYVCPETFFSSTSQLVVGFEYESDIQKAASMSKSGLPIHMYAWKFNPETGEKKGDKLTNQNYDETNLSSGYGKMKRSLLIEMINQHIIVHSDTNSAGSFQGMVPDKHYYLSRKGAPVYIGDTNFGEVGMTVEGGYQMDVNNDDNTENDVECKVTEVYDQTQETNGYGNGMTYLIDRPLQATMYSAYHILEDADNTDSPYSSFFKLCDGVDINVLENAGIFDGMSDNSSERTSEQQKYSIFSNEGIHCPDYNVRSFNNYNYTIYVPTNDAMTQALNAGLPTWEGISQYLADNTDSEGNISEDVKTIAKAKIVCLINFLKYHFQDRSVFDDTGVIETTDYETACMTTRIDTIINSKDVVDSLGNVLLDSLGNKIVTIDTTYNETNAYAQLEIQSSGKGHYQVIDKTGVPANVIEPENRIARDVEFDGNSLMAREIEMSSYIVIHQVDKYLNFMEGFDGNFDDAWKSTDKAKRFVKKYQLKK